MSEIMTRFKQWVFLKPLGLTVRKGGRKVQALPHRINGIVRHREKSKTILKPVKTNKKINPSIIQGGFKPLPAPEKQAQPFSELQPLAESRAYFPLGRVTPLQIEENIHHLTREMDTDGKHRHDYHNHHHYSQGLGVSAASASSDQNTWLETTDRNFENYDFNQE